MVFNASVPIFPLANHYVSWSNHYVSWSSTVMGICHNCLFLWDCTQTIINHKYHCYGETSSTNITGITAVTVESPKAIRPQTAPSRPLVAVPARRPEAMAPACQCWVAASARFLDQPQGKGCFTARSKKKKPLSVMNFVGSTGYHIKYDNMKVIWFSRCRWATTHET